MGILSKIFKKKNKKYKKKFFEPYDFSDYNRKVDSNKVATLDMAQRQQNQIQEQNNMLFK